MSINKKNVSNRLFDILVGTGHAIIMGDEDGKKTLDPNVAVRFYISNKHSMVYFNQAEGLISLSVGNNQRYDDVKDLINSVKQTAKHYLLNFNVKNYGKKLEPKDFAFQVTNEDVSGIQNTEKITQIETPAFKAWFGNSKVVDNSGKPLVVYHGTEKDFSVFDSSKTYHRVFYFAGQSSGANNYAKSTSGRTRTGAKVLPVYLSLQNPLIIDMQGEEDLNGLLYEIDDAKEAGHDGLIAKNTDDGYQLVDQYIAFNPTQIKSAIGNKGSFNPESGNITESANMTGTKKLSYQKMESAKIIIRHTKSVNEEVKGARSRSIQAIFIENAQGERFSYPFKYLDGARAICRHVSEGGNPYDEKGQQLIKLAEQYIALRKFVSHANRSNFVNEETGTLVELAQQKALQIGKAMKSGKGLSEMTTLVAVEDAGRLEAMTGNFTKKTVNKAVESAMPYVLQLLDQHNLQESTSNNLTELIAVIAAFPSVELTKMDDSDTNHPKNLKFAGSDIRNQHVAKYLVKHMVNPDLRYKVEELINNYDTLDQVQKDSVVDLLRTLIRKAKVINNEHVTNISVKDNVLSGISEEISKYTASKILAKN